MPTTLPYIILEHIAFYLAVIPSASCSPHILTPTPPSYLLPLLLSNKAIYDVLNIRSNPHLYARIFQTTFDSRAMRRRRKNDDVHVAELAHELGRRWNVLKRFRGRVVERTGHSGREAINDEELLRTDLWTVFIMFLENDGRNALVLMRYAHIDAFALHCLRPGGLLHDRAVDTNGGWTIESEVNALLGWIFWFTDFDRVPNESIEQRDEIIEALSPLYVGSFKYAFPHAPISFFYHPFHPTRKIATRRIQTNAPPAYTLPAAQNPSIYPLSTSPIHPPCLVPSSSSSSLLTLARPLPIPPTILSYVSRQEHQYLRWPREPSGVPRGSSAPATREEARRTGWIGPTGEDYIWFLGVRTKLYAGLEEDNLDPRSWEDEARTLSKGCDIDWARLLLCFNPFGPSQRFQSSVRVYEPGMLDGLWDGKWLMIPPDTFHELLHSTEQGVPLPPGFRPLHIQTPMSFRIKEHHSFTRNPDYNLPYDDTGPGALRAWIPENIKFLQDGDQLNLYEDTTVASRSRFIGTYETFSPFVGHRERRRKARMGRAIEQKWMKERSGARRGHQRTSHNTVVNERSSDDSMSVDYEYRYDEDEDTDTDSDDEDESLFGHGVWDIIITAESEPPFAEAWGSLSFRGRVRPWDGLVVLERKPANGTGRWIFRGYLHGGVNLVGRWRETGTQFDAPGWEGAWVMGRRT